MWAILFIPIFLPCIDCTDGALSDTQLDTLIPVFGSNQVQLQIRDLVNVSPTPAALNRIRIELREFLFTELQLSSSACEENVATVWR